LMLIFLLLGLRHGVMSTTADDPDGPVLLCSLLAVFLALGLAGWCNFFYGWNFAQTSMTLLVPFMTVGCIVVLFFGKHWKPQPLTTDLNEQVLMASAALTLAILVLSAVATAASTRLGQVMTIVVCCGVFLMALLSNHLIGRKVFENKPLSSIAAIRLEDPTKPYNEPGQTMTIVFATPANEPPPVKSTVFYSPSPSGFPMLNEDAAPFQGNLDDVNDILGPGAAPSLIVAQAERQSITVRATGNAPLRASREPMPGDYVFTQPTGVNVPAMLAWVAIPNMQIFWLLDAVTQNRSIPGAYVILVGLYAACEIGVFLSLGVIMFQRRDVG
jgi:hypothetical protein